MWYLVGSKYVTRPFLRCVLVDWSMTPTNTVVLGGRVSSSAITFLQSTFLIRLFRIASSVLSDSIAGYSPVSLLVEGDWP